MPDAAPDVKTRLETALPEIEARYVSLQKHAGPHDSPEAAQMLDRLADKIGQLRRHRQELNGLTPQSRSTEERDADIRELEALKQDMAALLTEFEDDRDGAAI
ncbi:hypothetical protein [Actibacterium ureilyticum]|uniref:hypothetical protein n=1 Tax=Actibacterium ureilyticum TaxID=1590614 RepID=UPI000BAAD188|nr:hypothetical protein [Actibacterium ureilyticum]